MESRYVNLATGNYIGGNVMAKKYHWLKLPENFFKRHDIKIIKQMDNGEKYVIFYQQLLLESISHEGELRFSDLIPYDEKMLSIITDTDIDIVRSAMKVLTELGMVQILDDATIFMTDMEKMIGRDNGTERVRKHRERLKLSTSSDVTECNVTVTLPSNSNSISNSNSKSNKSKTPTYAEVIEYAEQRGRKDLAKLFFDYYEAGNWKKKDGKPVIAWKQQFITWESHNPAPVKTAAQKEIPVVVSENAVEMPEEVRKKMEALRERGIL